MISRSLAVSMRLLAWLVASAAVLAGVGLWQLARDPIDLKRLTAYVETALNENEAGIRFTVGGSRLELREDRSLGLLITDLRGSAPSGERLFEVPSAAIDISVRALLLHQTLAPSRFVAHGPELALMRSRDGGLGLLGIETSPTETATDIDPAQIVERLRAAPDRKRPLTFLDHLAIRDAVVHIDDRVTGSTYEVQDVSVSVDRRAEAIDLAADASVIHPAGDLAAGLSGNLGAEAEDLRYELELRGLRPGHLGPFVSTVPVDLKAFDIAADIEASGSLSIEGIPGPVDLALSTSGGRIAMPELFPEGLDLDDVDVTASIDPLVGTIDLKRFDIAAHRAAFSLSGQLGFYPEGIGAEIHLDGEGIERAELDRLWPLGVGANAREWVMENILAGRVSRASIDLTLEPGDLEREVLRDEALSGWYDAESVTVRYFETMPPIEGASGRATLTGQSMGFEIGGGGVDDLRIADAEVMIDGIGFEGPYTTQLELVAEIGGPLDQVLSLIDLPPLGFPSRLGIDPGTTSGSTSTRIRLGFPLYRNLGTEEIRIAALSEVKSAVVANFDDRFDLDNGDLDLDVTAERMILTGEARLNGLPVDLQLQETFEGAGPPTQFRVDTEIDRPELLRLLKIDALPVVLDGTVGARIEGTQDEGRDRVEATFVLDQAKLGVPEIGYEKPQGAPGSLALAIDLVAGEPISIDNLVLRAGALNLDANFSLDAETFDLQRLIIDHLRYGRSTASGVVSRRRNGYAATIDAPLLDLMPLIEGGLLDQGEGDGQGSDESTLVALDIRATRLLYEGRAFRDALVRFERNARGFQSALVRGTLPDGSMVRADLMPDGPDHTLTATVENTGALLQYAGDLRRVEGGSLRLDARVLRQKPDRVAEGTLRVTDFKLLRAPVVARVLTLASFRGISNLVGGEGIFFDRLLLPFRIEGERIIITDGRLSGSQLGFSLDGTIDYGRERYDLRGTVVPIYTLNRIIGKIPIIGQFLTGSEGEGAFAVTFKVRGDFEQPNVTVNPLAVLAPGFVRELFRGLRNGTLDAPDAPPDAD